MLVRDEVVHRVTEVLPLLRAVPVEEDDRIVFVSHKSNLKPTVDEV
jgi:hypothetical protein